MKNNDTKPFEDRRMAVRTAMQAALNKGDQDAYYKAFDQMLEIIADDVKQQYEQKLNTMQEAMDAMQADMDSRVLTARGVRQLTSEERTFWQKFGEAAGAADPKQAVTNLDVVMPRTVINSVFEDLATNHPLLSEIDFLPSGGSVKMFLNENDYQEAAWGTLTAEITKELTSGIKEVNSALLKLTAFLPVAKSMLDLGPEWLDNYVRQVLYEAEANGLEAGFVAGDGKDKPIGMNRQVGEGVTVTGGVYPEKEAIPVSDFYPETVGGLLAQLAVHPNGKVRQVKNVILLVNPVDYFLKVMPSTTIMNGDGTYRNDVLPYPIKIIPSPAKAQGRATLGLGKRYFAAAGAPVKGKIEYSDHYRFLEDERVYLVKTYSNGMPKDNNAFLELDITNLQPVMHRVVTVDPVEAAAVADGGAGEAAES